MNPRITLVTLGVSDYSRSLRFYKDGLGWPTSGRETDPIAFFRLSNIVLAIFDKKALAEDAGVDSSSSGFPGFTLAHNVDSAEKVDEIFVEVKKLGTRIVKAPQRTSWGGYSGYFADPDGYLWEVAFNPDWKLDAEGHAVLN
jgi:uncharacterized protein